METIGAELNDAIVELSEAVSTSEEGTAISGDPGAVIASFKKEAIESHEKYVEFKEKQAMAEQGHTRSLSSKLNLKMNWDGQLGPSVPELWLNKK